MLIKYSFKVMVFNNIIKTLPQKSYLRIIHGMFLMKYFNWTDGSENIQM